MTDQEPVFRDDCGYTAHVFTCCGGDLAVGHRFPCAPAEASGAGDHDWDYIGPIVTEYGLLYSGGGYLLRNPDPEIEKIYPTARWIENERRTGGHVSHRKVIVIEDWEEME